MNPLLFVIFCCHAFKAVAATDVIDPYLAQLYSAREKESTENVFVTFNQGPHIVIEEINTKSFSSMHKKRTALTEAQQAFANQVQGPLQKFLEGKNIAYETFWINNKMFIPNATYELVKAISAFPEVTKIYQEVVVMLDPVITGKPVELREDTPSEETKLEWGIKRIRADEVWKSYKGKGVVVAGIDTGVLHTHETLTGRWREHYGWFDAISGKKLPYDDNGHGTHTMGTIAGAKGIGVAPEVWWMACKSCTGFGSCPESGSVRCGQWVQCPTDWEGKNKNCKMTPDIVSNSWGGHGKDRTYYDAIITSWQAAGIIPVFSIGNSGPLCKTTGSPGDRPDVISVGSTDEHNLISSFSSLGPSADGVMQPLITAPGGDVRSAWPTNNTAYHTISGTSMACPHVSGVIALMRQKAHKLPYDKVFDAIISTASHKLNDSSAPSSCGYLVTSRFPNNIFGYGLIDAVDAVHAAKK